MELAVVLVVLVLIFDNGFTEFTFGYPGGGGW